jgi:hypothetical protein
MNRIKDVEILNRNYVMLNANTIPKIIFNCENNILI